MTTGDLTLADLMPEPPKRRMPRHLVWLACAVAAAAVLAGGGVYLLVRPSSEPATASTAAGAQTFSATGTMQLIDVYGRWPAGQSCRGQGGYKDIAGGTTVSVTDAAGKTVALGTLSAGTVVETPAGFNVCEFNLVVTGIPAGGGFYGVEVSHRGRVQYDEKTLSGQLLHLTLG